MSGDVQPRKRKDKKRKKDELVVEEPRGTAAALGEGDVFMHSYHDHGTGGHWCAKIIFFSLLAILLTLIGLIILENRGLSELEANAVESRYSGVLDGWLEDAPDDDHHDEHTLELNHPVHSFKETSTKDGIPEDHDDEETESNEVDDGDNDDEHGENYDDDHENELSEEEDDDELQESQEDNEEVDDEQGNVEQLGFYARYFGGESTKQVADRNPANSEENNNDEENNSEEFDEQGEDDDEANNDNENEREADDDDEDSDEYNEENDDDDDSKDKELNDDDDDEKNNYNSENDELEEPTKNGESQEYEDDDEHDEHDDEDDDHDEVEHIEKEVSEEEPLSLDLPVLPEADDDKEDSNERDDDGSPEENNEDEEFLEQDADDDDDDEPIVERITAPAGKPFVEIDDDDLDSTQKSPDTLEEEEEYEKKQEELRREEEEQGSNKDGGKSVANQWPGEPSDTHWRQQLDTAEDELIQGAWLRALERTSKPQLSSSGRARWISARALDLMAEAKRDNALLTRAINAYVHLLKMNEGLSDRRLIEVSSKALERIKFRGNYISAEPVYRMLIRRFPKDPVYRNNLTISFLMAGRSDLAERVLKETLELWPEDRVALAHYGFILKTEHKRYEEAIDMFQKALEGDSGPASEPRFYYHFGDSLLLLGRFKEAHEVHKRGAALGHFLSPAQRSLYNVERLKSQPWWDVSTSPYSKLARALEKSWREILKEGEAARAHFEKENEGLKERGDWTQMDLYVRGREIPGRCKQAPVTCSIIKAESGGCSRGQVKFSAMVPGTHVRPHVGPTNCRLRMHLGLSNTKDTYLRVDKETRQWQLGKVLMFDDSFEHEVWHNGTGTRLVLIVDVWHPDLTPAERRQLPPI